MNRCELIKLICPCRRAKPLRRLRGETVNFRSANDAGNGDCAYRASVGLIGREFRHGSCCARSVVQVSIFCQRVDIAKLLLYLLDALDAAGVCVSVAVGDHDCPSGTARYNRHFD